MSRPHPTGAGLQLLGLLMALLVPLFAACGGSTAATAPQEIIGTWAAQGNLYADRTLEIRADRLYFGTGSPEDLEPLTIVRVRWEEETDHTLYSIVYQSADGDEYTLPLQFFPEARELRLANRSQVVWKIAPGKAT